MWKILKTKYHDQQQNWRKLIKNEKIIKKIVILEF